MAHYAASPRNNAKHAVRPLLASHYMGANYGDADIDTLLKILRERRPHDSTSERLFVINQFDGYEYDKLGNSFLRIEGEGDNIAWASHTDTVHHYAGSQRIKITDDFIYVDDSDSNCLGADDGAGVWLMLEMIRAKKPGFYMFHRGEECGGIGSTYIAQKTPERLAGIDAVISLDRYGYQSVITEQFDLCASDEFADSLAELIGFETLAPDPTGLFTDSANYTDLVGECTNLSVGYFGHHGANECQDLAYLCALRHALINLDTSRLVFSRKPGESNNTWGSYYRGSNSLYGDSIYGNSYKRPLPTEDEAELAEFLKDNADDVAHILLKMWGITKADLEKDIFDIL